jgi:ribosomal protein L32E
MSATQDPFRRMNDCFRKATYTRWHRQQSKQQILRSQLGFKEPDPSRPKPCRGCSHYHGVRYTHPDGMKSLLICAFHPLGWQGEHCPDWQEIV